MISAHPAGMQIPSLGPEQTHASIIIMQMEGKSKYHLHLIAVVMFVLLYSFSFLSRSIALALSLSLSLLLSFCASQVPAGTIELREPQSLCCGEFTADLDLRCIHRPAAKHRPTQVSFHGPESPTNCVGPGPLPVRPRPRRCLSQGAARTFVGLGFKV